MKAPALNGAADRDGVRFSFTIDADSFGAELAQLRGSDLPTAARKLSHLMNGERLYCVATAPDGAAVDALVWMAPR